MSTRQGDTMNKKHTQGRGLCGAGTRRLMLGAGVVLVSLPAQADDSTLVLDTQRVTGLRLYDMASSEESGGYSVDAATVGSKVPASLRDIPQSVSVVTHDAIEDQNFITLDQLAARTPGVRVLNNDSGRSSIFARGYEYDAYSIDGLSAPMSSLTGSVPSLTAIDRVEVMRGPSGLFNSTSELGGVINLVRKRPTDTFQGSISGSVGTLDDRSVSVDISGPIDAQGRIRGRLVTRSTEQAQWVDDNDNTLNDFYGALDIDLDENTELSLGVIHNTKDITVNQGQPVDSDGNLSYGRSSAFYGADWNSFESDSTDVIAELTHHFSSRGYGRLAARYSDRNADYEYAYSGSALSDSGDMSSVAGYAGFTDETSVSVDASYTQGFDAFGNQNEFVVGVDYKTSEADTTAARTSDLTGSSASISELNNLAYVDILGNARDGVSGYSLSRTKTTLEEQGLYGKVTLRPVAPLAVILGARISHFSADSEDRINGGSSDMQDTAVTPYGGLVYDLDADHSIYASYSKVFEPQTSEGEDGDLIDPREGEQYEIGIKGSYLDGALNARISGFQLTDSHRAASSTDSSVDYSVDSGKMRITGAELELAGNITPQWDVIFGYTYMDSEVLEAGSSDALLMLMPNNMVNLWTQYRFEGNPLDGVSVGAGMTALSDFDNTQGTIHAPGYAVFDAMLGYQFTPRLSGQLNVYNLFDREYYVRAGSASVFNFVGRPASAVATMKYEF